MGSWVNGKNRDFLMRSVYARCKQLNAPIAVVGSKSSAVLLLEIIDKGGLPFAGVFEQDSYRAGEELNGHPIRPMENLAQLDPKTVVVIASTAESTDLYDTFEKIRSLCPCRSLNLKSLADVYLLRTELKSLLDFKFDDFIFQRGFHALGGENPYWHPVPPNVDFSGKTVLELGPFEGHDTLMILAQNPKKVIALEARPSNYAKISTVRSLFNWKNHELHLGDMHLFPQLIQEKIDIVSCSGVFYHSDKPWWLLQTCMEQADTIILGGHVASKYSRHERVVKEVTLDSGTYHFEIYPESDDHLAGITRQSLWFREEELIRFLDHHGFGYEKYFEGVVEPTGLWIFSVVKKKTTP